MIQRKVRDMQTALAKKGFLKDADGPHIYFRFYFKGKKTSLWTCFSHGDAEVRGGRINLMGRQVGLDKTDFLALVDCDLDEAGYIKKLLDSEQLRDTPNPPSAA